jgi:hypothetical protein
MADIYVICIYCYHCCSVTVYDGVAAVFTKEVDPMIDDHILVIGAVVNENPVTIGRIVKRILDMQVCLSISYIECWWGVCFTSVKRT